MFPSFPAAAFAKQFKMEKAKVIRINGISHYSEYEIDNTTESEAAASTE